MTNLQDKVIIITGSTQGLGKGFARHCAQLGAKIVISGRNVERGQHVQAEIEALGTECLFVPAELSKPDQVQNIVAQCDARFGRVDGLVNSAGLSTRSNIDDTTVELWDYLFAVNVRAPFLLIQACVPIMRREGINGSVVNIQSVSGYGGQARLLAYSITKGALATLTKSTANALLFERVRVNGINLGWTHTDGEEVVQAKQEGQPLDWYEIAGKAMPTGRMMTPNDVAPLVAYLLSDASLMMSGANIDFAQNMVIGASD